MGGFCIGKVAIGRVCACSLPSRLVSRGSEAVKGNIGLMLHIPPVTPKPVISVATPAEAQETARTARLFQNQLRIEQ